MNERIHQFGEKGGLFGILSLPEGGVLTADRPIVVMLNAGLVHRVGPFRMHVPLARRLASLGFGVFRMDQSGLGDSSAQSTGESFEAQSVKDATAAFDFLSEKYNAQTFLIFGLCTGAMNAHRVALRDPRVAAACLLDGYAYKTRGAEVRRIAPKVLDPKVWGRLMERGANIVASKMAGIPLLERSASAPRAAPSNLPWTGGANVFEQDWPPLSEVRRELEQIIARGTELLFVYSGGWSNYVHGAQFDEMFPNLPRRTQINVHYLPEADHTYLVNAHREALYDVIVSWLTTSRFGKPR
jgi:pimeloyl-ACP methyl ester carboxylesterase